MSPFCFHNSGSDRLSDMKGKGGKNMFPIIALQERETSCFGSLCYFLHLVLRKKILLVLFYLCYAVAPGFLVAFQEQDLVMRYYGAQCFYEGHLLRVLSSDCLVERFKQIEAFCD